MMCDKPPSSDALHGTCRGSVEPLSEGGSPRTKPIITSGGDLVQPTIDLHQQGDLVFAWSIREEKYIPFQFECYLLSKVGRLCWVINLEDGSRIRKKIRDLWIPRI